MRSGALQRELSEGNRQHRGSGAVPRQYRSTVELSTHPWRLLFATHLCAQTHQHHQLTK